MVTSTTETPADEIKRLACDWMIRRVEQSNAMAHELGDCMAIADVARDNLFAAVDRALAPRAGGELSDERIHALFVATKFASDCWTPFNLNFARAVLAADRGLRSGGAAFTIVVDPTLPPNEMRCGNIKVVNIGAPTPPQTPAGRKHG